MADITDRVKETAAMIAGVIIVMGMFAATFHVVRRAYGVSRLEARQDSLVTVIEELETSRDSLSGRYCQLVVAMGAKCE